MAESLTAPASGLVTEPRPHLTGVERPGDPGTPVSDCGVWPSAAGTSSTDCDDRPPMTTRSQSPTVIDG
jgi:hypothetical protein